jgi:hypothetical protein
VRVGEGYWGGLWQLGGQKRITKHATLVLCCLAIIFKNNTYVAKWKYRNTIVWWVFQNPETSSSGGSGRGGPKTARVGAKRLGGFSFLGSGHLRDLIHKASADLRRPNMQRLFKTNQKQSICGSGAQLQLFLFVVLGCARHP